MYTVLYNKQIANAIREIKPPYPNLKLSVVEYPGMLSLRVYEENIAEFNAMQHISIMEYLNMLRNIVESFGVKCDLEGVKSK